MASLESLTKEIEQHSALYQLLQKQKDDPAALEEARLKLGELKKSKGALMSAAGGGSKDKKKGRLLLKTPKVRTSLRDSPTCQLIILYTGHTRLWVRRDVLSRTH